MSDVVLSDNNEMEPPMKRLRVEEPNADDTDLADQDSKVCHDADMDKDIDGGPKSSLQVSEEKCTDYVTPEELERLHQFQVLDEVRSDDGDSDNNEQSDSSDDKSEEVPEEEIEKMLEENLPEALRGAPKPKEKTYVTRQKIVLEEKGVNHFEVLPLDWMMVRHYSGMPVYMHRTTRVCTLAKPYFLGKGNTRRHDIPISAIPCLAYRKALEEEAKQKEIDKDIEEQIKKGTWQQEKPHDDINNKNIYVNNDTPGNEVNGSSDVKTMKDINNTEKCLTNNLETNADNDVSTTEKITNDLSAPDKPLQQSQPSKCPFSHKSKESSEIKPNIVSNVNNDSLKTTEVTEQTHEHYNLNKVIGAGNEIKMDAQIIISEGNEIIIDPQQKIGNDNDTVHSQQKICDGDENSIDSNLEIGDSNDNHGQNTLVEQNKNEKKDDEEPICKNGVDKPNEEVENGDKGSEGAKSSDEIPLNRKPVVLPGGVVMPPPRVECAGSSWKCQHLTPEQVTDYCRALFRFNTLNIMQFRRWADRRKYTKARKTLQYPALPEGTKLITIPAALQAQGQNNTASAGRSRRDWVMNMNGRSYLSVFHEYVRRALQKQPVYEFKQLENAAAPYQATVYIGGMQYGVGSGSSKRAAKASAATASIHILIPEMRPHLAGGSGSGSGNGKPDHEPDFSFFDCIGIEDPRITEFCAATCEPSPHAILRTCLLRNFGAGDRHIHTEMKKLEYQKIELTMRVGRHTATVLCKNKKSAKQRASQAILQLLHPHVSSWGSLLRLYGSRSLQSGRDRKLEEQQITLLQDSARQNEPNYAVLEKLRNEMRKLRERDGAVVPIGSLLLKDDLPTHSGSNLNNVQL